jgi:hypothetical protein
LNAEKTNFFNAAARPIEPSHLQRSAFDMRAMQQALSSPSVQEGAMMHNVGPMVAPAFEPALKAESQMGDWAMDFMRQADSMMKASGPPIVQSSVHNPVHNGMKVYPRLVAILTSNLLVQSFMPPGHMLRPMMPIPMHAPPLSTLGTTNTTHSNTGKSIYVIKGMQD